MRPPQHAVLPERISALSISDCELVVPEAAALEALNIAEEKNVLVLGWEGWVKTADGGVGHGSAPQGTVSLENLTVQAAAEFCRQTIVGDAAQWRLENPNSSEQLYFCLTFEVRLVTIVVGYKPAIHSRPKEAVQAGLEGTVAAVLSTYRTDSPEMVLDHSLWLACARAVTDTVSADDTLVFAENNRGLFARLLRRSQPRKIGSLEAYAAEFADPDPRDWGRIFWCRDGALVAAAVSEPWYALGGPDLYHDSYTPCVFISPAKVASLVQNLQLKVHEEGGCIDDVVDPSGRPA